MNEPWNDCYECPIQTSLQTLLIPRYCVVCATKGSCLHLLWRIALGIWNSVNTVESFTVLLRHPMDKMTVDEDESPAVM